MIEDFLGIIMVSTLIGKLRLSSVMFFSIGIGLICAIYEVNIKRKMAFEKKVLVLIEGASVICFSVACIGEMDDWLVAIVALGACGILIGYNLKQKTKVSVPFFVISLAGLMTSICSALDPVRIIIFSLLGTVFFGLLIIKRNCPVYKQERRY